ncbi:autophagy-related protein 22-like protein [Polychytrium aggregatum]|uniref:autophagy-related protein 22-like protein n=1 Tax=Polychytrium aggregatum TaxID=110093 RepID=UPI0022FEB2DD|nr:autophagy-related protein 22-like protein [Polychytrium aggregatum]KAI9199273.1 autophagy-related protein 22-like protein [Polychytrium aggregatum]
MTSEATLEVVDEGGHQGPLIATKKELQAWYWFGWASEGYYALGVAALTPLIIRGLASENGYDNNNLSQPCNITVADYSCSVKIGSSYINTDSYYFYANTITTFIQFILFMGFGALADHGERRKSLMLFFSTISAILGLGFLVVVKASLYWLATLFYMFGVMFFNGSYVLFYSFVPVLAKHHPQVVEAKASNMSADEISKVEDKVTNIISGNGLAWGYAAAVINLIIGIAVLVAFAFLGTNLTLPTSTYAMQVVMAIPSIWWLCFQILPMRNLPARPGSPLPEGTNKWTYSYKKIFKTISRARRLPVLSWFLLGWFIYSDAFNTTISVAVLFAQDVIHLASFEILIIATIIPCSAFIGIYFWLWIKSVTGLTTSKMLVLQACLYALLPAYGLIGIFSTTIGLRNRWEAYMFGVYHGLLLGSTQSFCRSIYSEIVPPGREAEFFSLYNITDKGSAWVGPLVVAAIIQGTGIRYNSMYFLLVSFLVPIIVFATLNIEKGKKEALAFVESEKAEAAEH